MTDIIFYTQVQADHLCRFAFNLQRAGGSKSEGENSIDP
jgi:hypothetical protein